MRTVLAALDASASAPPVLRAAIAVASLFDATPIALHVRENHGDEVRRLAGSAGVELRELDGAPVQQLVAAAQAPDVVALVLGARGARPGPEPAGHTALELITRVPKAVVIVGPRTRPPAQISRVLVPLEGTSESSEALQQTIRLAHRRELEILVLHVHTPETLPAFANHDPHAARAWEREFLRRYAASPPQSITLLRRVGLPADRIVTVAHDSAADLIVLSWSQNIDPGHARVITEVLAHAGLPLLLLIPVA